MPASDEDLSWAKQPATVEKSETFDAALSVPAIPRGHTLLNEVQSLDKEEYGPAPDRLHDGVTWFYPALIYCVVGVNKSLFELYKLGARTKFRVGTYLSESPIIRFAGMDMAQDTATYNWLRTVQCIPEDDAIPFISYIESFEFRGPPGGVNWKAKFQKIRIADPFCRRTNGDRIGAEVWVALPYDLMHNKVIGIVKDAGLRLDPPILGVMDVPRLTFPLIG